MSSSAISSDDVRQLRWNSDLVKKFWDYQSRFPDAYFTSQFGDQIAGAVRNRLPRNAKILDYACGTGALTGHLLDCGMSVASSDLSSASLNLVRQRFDDHKSFLGAFSIEELASSALKFDGAVLVELVEHVDDGVLEQILSDVHRALVPGGVLVITCPNDEKLLNETVYCPCCNHTFHRWQHVRSWSGQSLSTFLSTRGFKPLTAVETDFSLRLSDGWLRYGVKKILRAMRKGGQPPHLIVTASRL